MTTDTDSLYGASALAMVTDLTGEMQTSVPGWVDQIGDDTEALAILLDDLRTQQDAIGNLAGYVESQLARRLTDRDTRLPSGWVLMKRRTVTTTWDHPATLRAVLAHLAADADTGEMLLPPEAVAPVVDLLTNCAYVAYWRTKALAALGIRYAELRTREPGRATVRIAHDEGEVRR